MSETKTPETKEQETKTPETKEQETKTPETKTAYDPWEKVQVSIPRGSDRGDPNVTVIMNGKSYIIPRGKKSEVPRCVAEELARSERAKDAYFEASEKLQSKQGI